MHDKNGNTLCGNIVDVVYSRTYPGRLEIEDSLTVNCSSISAFSPRNGSP